MSEFFSWIFFIFVILIISAAILFVGILVGKITPNNKFYFQEKSAQCDGFDIRNTTSYITIQGSSMLPTIQPGNLVLTVPYNSSRIIVMGDIVGTNVTDTMHRVTAVYKDGFYMKGDNNPTQDLMEYNYSDILFVACGVLYE